MSQALGNILSNAIDCTHDVGNIVLRVKLEGNAVMAISLIDDGVGIDAADLPHVFDRFYRTEESRLLRRQGRGLGLSIARSIVEANEGTIAVTSDGLGHGVTVTIRLPTNT